MDKQILVVDDVDDDARVMGDIIERIMGLTTMVASDGAQAIGMALQNRPDLILMDLNLSALESGWDVVGLVTRY